MIGCLDASPTVWDFPISAATLGLCDRTRLAGRDQRRRVTRKLVSTRAVLEAWSKGLGDIISP